MKRMLEHPPLYSDGSSVDPQWGDHYRVPVADALVRNIATDGDQPRAEHIRAWGFWDWIALLATPLIRWPLPLPPQLQIDAALITNEGSPTPLAAWRAARAGDETIA